MRAAVTILLATTIAFAGPAIPAGADADGRVLVTFVRSGGFAGLDDHLRIERDGAARVEGAGGRTAAHEVPEHELRQLRAELDAAGFPGLEGRYGDDPPVADGYAYEVTYAERTVACEQSAGPPALERVIAHLERILAGVQATSRATDHRVAARATAAT